MHSRSEQDESIQLEPFNDKESYDDEGDGDVLSHISHQIRNLSQLPLTVITELLDTLNETKESELSATIKDDVCEKLKKALKVEQEKLTMVDTILETAKQNVSAEKEIDPLTLEYIESSPIVPNRHYTPEALLEKLKRYNSNLSELLEAIRKDVELTSPRHGGQIKQQIEQELQLISHNCKIQKEFLDDPLGKNAKPEDLNLNETLAGILEPHKRKVPRNKNLKLSLHSPDIFIKARKYDLRLVFDNLLGNALKFTVEGSISIDVEEEKSDMSDQNSLPIRITMKDTGIGIPADKLPSLFGQFVQVHENTKEQNYGGSGYGLSAVKNTVEKELKGNIEVFSEKGEGTTFVLSCHFEKAAIKNKAEQTPPAPSVEISKNEKIWNKKTILIVEDMLSNRKTMIKDVVKLGYQCVAVSSGEEAIEQIQNKEYPIDMVFMDIELGSNRIDGFEATEQMRELGVTVPIVGLTGHIEDRYKKRGRDAGMNEMLNKPIKITKELLSKYFPDVEYVDVIPPPRAKGRIRNKNGSRSIKVKEKSLVNNGASFFSILAAETQKEKEPEKESEKEQPIQLKLSNELTNSSQSFFPKLAQAQAENGVQPIAMQSKPKWCLGGCVVQ